MGCATTLERNLARFDRRSVPAGREPAPRRWRWSWCRARPVRAAVLLTRRAAGLRRHGGQWALPGGRLDPGETPETAALRELEEEVGLTLPAGAILGCLDDFPTRSGFVITPVVVWGIGPAPLRPDPREVAAVYRVPLGDLLNPANLVVHSIPQSDRPVLALAILGTLSTPRRRRSCTSSPRWRCRDGRPGWPTTSSRCSRGGEAGYNYNAWRCIA